jgi:hypothetical protein
MVYMVNVVITIVGTYNITSTVPNCVSKDTQHKCVALDHQIKFYDVFAS